jgi:hypothetical protein
MLLPRTHLHLGQLGCTCTLCFALQYARMLDGDTSAGLAAAARASVRLPSRGFLRPRPLDRDHDDAHHNINETITAEGSIDAKEKAWTGRIRHCLVGAQEWL